jgi:hypothetical protein
MGLFDYFRSAYNLGEHFTDTICQTKTIEDDYSGTMTEYWLDPTGVLWHPDYDGTQDFQEITEDDPRYDNNKLWVNFEWIPTGKHGKFRRHLMTKSIEIYPAKWKGNLEEWPRMRLDFKEGVLQNYQLL